MHFPNGDAGNGGWSLGTQPAKNTGCAVGVAGSVSDMGRWRKNRTRTVTALQNGKTSQIATFAQHPVLKRFQRQVNSDSATQINLF